MALERERSAGMVLAVEGLLRETWEEVLDEVVVDVWLDWEGVQRREERMCGALRRRARGKRDVGMGRRRRRRRRRERLRAEQREREQLGREVQQRLDFVRWEERQEGKWEAAAAAVVSDGSGGGGGRGTGQVVGAEGAGEAKAAECDGSSSSSSNSCAQQLGRSGAC